MRSGDRGRPRGRTRTCPAIGRDPCCDLRPQGSNERATGGWRRCGPTPLGPYPPGGGAARAAPGQGAHHVVDHFTAGVPARRRCRRGRYGAGHNLRVHGSRRRRRRYLRDRRRPSARRHDGLRTSHRRCDPLRAQRRRQQDSDGRLMEGRPSPHGRSRHLAPRISCCRLDRDQTSHSAHRQDHLYPLRLDHRQLVVIGQRLLHPGRPGPAHPGKVRYDSISGEGDESEITVPLADFKARACQNT